MGAGISVGAAWHLRGPLPTELRHRRGDRSDFNSVPGPAASKPILEVPSRAPRPCMESTRIHHKGDQCRLVDRKTAGPFTSKPRHARPHLRKFTSFAATNYDEGYSPRFAGSGGRPGRSSIRSTGQASTTTLRTSRDRQWHNGGHARAAGARRMGANPSRCAALTPPIVC